MDKVRKVVTKTFGPDADGHVYEYFEGYINSEDFDDLPTEFIANGSNVIESDTGNWDFFNEKTQSWSTLLNIGD